MRLKLLIITLFVCMICTNNAVSQKSDSRNASKELASKLSGFRFELSAYRHLGKMTLDSVAVKRKMASLYFGSSLSYIPFREELVKRLYATVKDSAGVKYSGYSFTIYADKRPIETLIPNYYRESDRPDKARMTKSRESAQVAVKVDGRSYVSGLSGRNIAMWHSHGWYYESSLNRWEWQRARLFGTVEDLYTMSYVIPYLVPMLENSGASVFIPRERDIQSLAVVVDNDKSSDGGDFIVGPVVLSQESMPGFLLSDTIFSGTNPFKKGTSLGGIASSTDASFTYLPHFAGRGDYAVYVSYPFNQKNGKVIYDINHLGGTTSFTVDQRMGAGTWIYLGTFAFDAEKNIERGSVMVRGMSKGAFVAADAVRFGGGIGNVARRLPAVTTGKKLSATDGGAVSSGVTQGAVEGAKWQVSGRPRFVEAARYYLQYAGAPESVYNINKNSNDYNDDYMSRGEWVNWLRGSAAGDTPGLGIPIDAAFAFHTDAGITPNDSVIGTLSIFSTVRDKGIFKNGRSKLASRDMSDIIQSQIVDDIRALYNPKWVRRGMWDKQYSEAWRPDVPVMLLELLSHQNFADMKYGLDPRFRFDVSRAIYKGFLRFLAADYGFEPVVQPLPVDNLVVVEAGKGKVTLSWKPVTDPLEPSATPKSYRIYTRIDDGGFDNGVDCTGTSYQTNIEQGKIYSFKVTAINDGGESFPSEVLAVGLAGENAPLALVVNGFDRVSAPSFVDKDDFAGVAWWDDEGVADKYDLAHVGRQYNFNRNSQWLDDDSPGWGASHSDMEGRVIAGNTFDYTYLHGKALMNNGISFVSASDEAFVDDGFPLSGYSLVDVILGEEKPTPHQYDNDKADFRIYTPEFMAKMKEVAGNGINIIMSGAYVGTGLIAEESKEAVGFAAEVLHFKWRTGHASTKGIVNGTASSFGGSFCFNTVADAGIYAVEAPDGIEPADKLSETVFRYGDSNISAAVAYRQSYGVVTLGFPVETVVGSDDRDRLMRQILDYFGLIK
jgi:hypothetical protein